MKWMTTEYPFYRQRHSPQKAMPLNRFNGVSRTCWIVPARRRQPGRNGFLIKANHNQSRLLHNIKPALPNRFFNCPICPARVSIVLSGYTNRIKSYPHCKQGFKVRYASLPSRLARFRFTAVPKPREKVKQMRLWGRLFLRTKSFAP